MIKHFLLEKMPISVVKFRIFVVGRRTDGGKRIGPDHIISLKLNGGDIEQCCGPSVNCPLPDA